MASCFVFLRQLICSDSDFKIRHCVMLKFKDGHPYTDPKKVKELVKATNEMRAVVAKDLKGPILTSCGVDLGLPCKVKDQQCHFMVTQDFLHPQDYEIYAAHPAHQEFIAKYLKPHLKERRAVQYQLDGSLPAGFHDAPTI